MTAPTPRAASSERSPVLAVMSTLAALQVLTGGAALGDIIGVKAAGLCILAVAAAQTGLQFYVRGQVTPWSAVAAKVADDGSLIAGPAADVPTGALVAEVEAAPVPRDAGHIDVLSVCLIVLFGLVVLLLFGGLPRA